MTDVFLYTRWPDGSELRCYSPSPLVEEYFVAGRSYVLADFAQRIREALTLGAEQVRATYQAGCTQALSQLEAIEAKVAAMTTGGHRPCMVLISGFD